MLAAPVILLSLPHVPTQHMPAAVAMFHVLMRGTAQPHEVAVTFARYQCIPALKDSHHDGEECSHCNAGLCGNV